MAHLIYILFMNNRVPRISKCTNSKYMRLQLCERSLALPITSKFSPNTHILNGYYTFLVAVGVPKEIQPVFIPGPCGYASYCRHGRL